MTLHAFWLIRAILNICFAGYFLLFGAPSGSSGLAQGAYFALSDGLVGLAGALSLTRQAGYGFRTVMAFFDAVCRLVVGAIALAFPDLNAFPLGATAFFSLVIFACIVIAAMGAIFAILQRRWNAARRTEHELAWPLLVAGALPLLMGIGFGLASPTGDERRLVLSAYALAYGAFLLLETRRLTRRV